MSVTTGISFLHQFDLGNRDPVTPGSKILSVPSTAAGDFDKANLTTESLRQVHRTTGIIGFQDYVIQADTPSNVDTFFIGGHNLTSAAVIQVQANTINDFTAPPVTKTLQFNKKNIVDVTAFGAVYEFYRVRILDPLNPCGFIEIGRIVGGRALIMQNDEDINDDIGLNENDRADVVRTEGFFRASNTKIKQLVANVGFQKLKTTTGEDANFVGLIALFDNVGISKPFLMIVDRGNPSFINLWGQLDKIPGRRFTVNQFVSMSLSMSEVF